MSGTLVQAEFVYSSGVNPNLYQFTILQNQAGELLVRDIQNPYGFVVSPYAQIPQSVTDDISDAMSQVESLMAATSTVNGTLTFVADTEESVVFVTAMSDTTYRVQLSTDMFTALRITNKLTTGFTVEASATVSGTVGYDVFI